MSDSTLKNLSFPRYTLEDTPSTHSTGGINSSIKSSPVASNPPQKSSPLVGAPWDNLPQANPSLPSPLEASYPQENTPLVGASEPIYAGAASPRPISRPSSPSAPTPPKLIFPRANVPSARSSIVTYLRSTSRASQRPMTTYPTSHLHPSHPGELHSIFLRAFHSPWSGTGRRLALAIRGFISLYMTVTFIMVVAWQARTEAAVSMVLFKFETISFFWQVAYSWITFVSLPLALRA